MHMATHSEVAWTKDLTYFFLAWSEGSGNWKLPWNCKKNIYCIEKAVYFLISKLEQLRSLLGNEECTQVISLYQVTLFVLLDHAGEKSPVVLLQYLFKNDEQEVRCLNPHGHSKRNVPYRRTFPSTIDKMKLSGESGKRPKYVLDEVYRSLGDVSH